MFTLIFTDDNIDQGRKKINDLLFTGNSTTSYWNFLNTGATSVSLQIINDNNEDISYLGGNIIPGYNNIISGTGGYNFVQGMNNYIMNTNNSFIHGNNNQITGLTDSFVFGSGNTIYGGNYLNILGINNEFNNQNNNNFLNIINSYNSFIKGDNTYLNIISSLNSNITGDTNCLTILSSKNTIISGSVTNSFVFGQSNSIGYNAGGSVLNFDNIYLFGSNLKPLLSSDTISALSGTYVNDLCIENNLNLNHSTQNVFINTFPVTNPNPILDFDKKNISILKSSLGNGTNFNSSVSASSPPNLNVVGLFFSVWTNLAGNVKSISGDSTYFIDNNQTGTTQGRWDMPSNVLSGNAIFMTYLPEINKYIRYKG